MRLFLELYLGIGPLKHRFFLRCLSVKSRWTCLQCVSSRCSLVGNRVPRVFQNISSVVAAFSDLLHVRIPNSYEVSSAPEVPSVGLLTGHRVNPALEYRQHLFLRGPPPASANPPRLASSYRLKPPNIPFPPTSNGELIDVFTPNSFLVKVTLTVYKVSLELLRNNSLQQIDLGGVLPSLVWFGMDMIMSTRKYLNALSEQTSPAPPKLPPHRCLLHTLQTGFPRVLSFPSASAPSPAGLWDVLMPARV